MRRTQPDDVLSDYVRDRLDRLVARSDGDAEMHQRTVLRPRPPLLIGNRGGSVAAEHRGAATQGFTDQKDDDRSGSEGASQKDSEALVGPVADHGSGLLQRFTGRHVTVVALVLLTGVLIGGYALTRARAVPVAVPAIAVDPDASGVPTAPLAPSSSSPTPEPILVHVLGEVEAPGVHRLADGSRVADAIAAAGGLNPAARPGDLNLAQPLDDGQQLVVGDRGRPSEIRGGAAGGVGDSGVSGATGAAGEGKINLNKATAAQLDALPGVGPVTAEKILAWRTEHGRFTRVEELQEVPGIGPKSFAEIAPHVTL